MYERGEAVSYSNTMFSVWFTKSWEQITNIGTAEQIIPPVLYPSLASYNCELFIVKVVGSNAICQWKSKAEGH